jgi:hypothetical protein
VSVTTHRVTAEVTADCPFSVAEEYAQAFLQSAQADTGEFAMRVPIRFLPGFVRHRVTMTFELHVDLAERGRKHDEIDVRWKAGTPFLPDFCGTVRFRIAGVRMLVRVDGAYRAPFGLIGELFDALVGAHIAHASATDFAARIGSYLEVRQRSWRAETLEAMAVT